MGYHLSNPNGQRSADANYTVEYDGNPATQGETVEILVTVGFTLNQAVAADIDGDTGLLGHRISPHRSS